MLFRSHYYLRIHLILRGNSLSKSNLNNENLLLQLRSLLTFKLCLIGPISFATRLPELNLLPWQCLLAVPSTQKHPFFSSGPLHMLFPLPEMFFCQIFTWFTLSFRSGLYLNGTSLETSPLTTVSKNEFIFTLSAAFPYFTILLHNIY